MSFRIFKFIWFSITLIILTFLYFYIGRLPSVQNQPPWIMFAFEKDIPFVPASVWYYLLGMYAPFVFVVEMMRTKKSFFVAMLGTYLSAFICFAFFIFFPMSYPRPPLEFAHAGMLSSPIWHIPGDLFSLKGMEFIYQMDSSSNTFPSLHIVYSMIFALALREEYPKYSTVFYLNAFIVFLTTLTTKQHFVMDGITGAGVAMLCMWVGGKIYKKFMSA